MVARPRRRARRRQPVLRAVSRAPGRGSCAATATPFRGRAELAADLTSEGPSTAPDQRHGAVRLLHIAKAAAALDGAPARSTSTRYRAAQASTPPDGWSASDASSGCSPRPPTPSRSPASRCCARSARRVLELAGPRADEPRRQGGHGRARGLPARRDVPDVSRASWCRSRRRSRTSARRRELRVFLRRDDYGRFVSCVVYLPRDRYNTPVRDRFTRILTRAHGRGERRVHRPGLGRRWPLGCTWWPDPPTARSCSTSTPTQLETELAEAARSWDDDLVEAGRAPPAAWRRPATSRPAWCVSTLSAACPRPTRRTTLPADGSA